MVALRRQVLGQVTSNEPGTTSNQGFLYGKLRFFGEIDIRFIITVRKAHCKDLIIFCSRLPSCIFPDCRSAVLSLPVKVVNAESIHQDQLS